MRPFFPIAILMFCGGCLGSSQVKMPACEGSPIHYGETVETTFFLQTDGTYISVGALESCPSVYMDVVPHRDGHDAFNDMMGDAREILLSRKDVVAVGDSEAVGQVQVAAPSSDDDLPRIQVINVTSLKLLATTDN